MKRSLHFLPNSLLIISRKIMKRRILMLACLMSILTFGTSLAQGVTSASIQGTVVDENGEPLPGATVVAIHVPSGTQYGTATLLNGKFNFTNVRIGGPYTITATFVGFQESKIENINLSLGQDFNLKIMLNESATELASIEVTGQRDEVMNSEKTGAAYNIGEESVSALPTVGRDLTDYLRLTPQAIVTSNNGISIAGMNNRYNSIFIDGAVSNDVFGLAENGTNGGQAGITPISVDAIEEFQVQVAPYDVKYGNFAGGAINAVTRSGTNTFHGSAYYFFRNENLAGKTPGDVDERTKLDPFTAKTYGFRLGGPIIKNKLFFFVNGEISRQKTPQPFNYTDFNSTYLGNSTQEEIESLSTYLKNTYNYDPGSYLNNPAETNSDKILAKIDWNINNKHKLSLRHSYTFGENYNTYRTSSTSINFYNDGIYFPSTTNSTALELTSNFSQINSNHLILAYTRARDDRNPLGQNFPKVRIYDGNGSIYFGSEEYSTANKLDQDNYTLTDDFTYYLDQHTITIGTHNEYYKVYNLFIRQNFGSYTFSSLDDFYNGVVDSYNRSYSLVDDVTGDGSKAAVEYKAMQLGLYIQDEWSINPQFKLSYGLRADVPFFITDANKTVPDDDTFNTTTINTLEGAGWDLKGAKLGQAPKAQFLLSPRIGFNWDVNGDRTLQVRGGTGIFTSRIPYVWPAGIYLYTGYTVGSTFENPGYFEPDPLNQPTPPVATPTGEIDLVAKNFKYPQVWKISLGIDKQLPSGIVASIEGIYTKNINNVDYKNLNSYPVTASTPRYDGPDNRPYIGRTKLVSNYDRIMLLENTGKGFSYNLTFQLQKAFTNGFTANLAYTYGRSKVLNEGTSSQNSSQWRYMENINGLNYLDLSYSDFDLGSRITAFLSYKKEYLGFMATTLSLFYNGQSGKRYSLIYNGSMTYDDTGSSSTYENLIYIPTDADLNEMVFEDAQQKADFKSYIENDDYLSKHRGEYSERNSLRLPFSNIIDLRLLQDFYLTSGSTKHDLQLSIDIFNFTNLLNKNWGRTYYIANDAYNLLSVTRPTFMNGDNTPTYSFSKPTNDIYSIDDSGINSSRWQGQIGLRYSF